MVDIVSITILSLSIVLYVIAAIKSKMMESLYILLFGVIVFAVLVVVERFISSMGVM